MNEETLRPVVEAHAAAVVDPIDVAHVGGDLSEDLRPQLASVAPLLPQPVTSASVDSLELDGDSGTAVIRYTGADKELAVRSVWKDIGGEAPKIVALELLD
jgi:hypothetical protein